MALVLRTLFVVLLVCSAAPAHARRPFRVVPAVYDPGHTGAVASAWEPFSGPGNSDPALVLSKQLATAADAAALATVENVAGIRLDELGFDVARDGHCGAGAPRFNVTTDDGTVYFFGCAYGNHTASPDKPATFERVRFSDADAFPQYATDPPWPGFGRARIAAIDLVFDEGTDVGPGFTALDDIDIDGTLVGRGHGHD
jgi:hypothetical protein